MSTWLSNQYPKWSSVIELVTDSVIGYLICNQLISNQIVSQSVID